MEMNGEQVVRAPRQKVWDALNDPTILSRCIPGCEEISKLSDDETTTRVAVKIGPVRARFSGRILRSDVVAPTSCTLVFEGAGGAAGFAKGQSRVVLTDDGANTLLAYTVNAAVGGKLGQIGGRLIDSSAKKMADEFFAAFDVALTGGSLPQAITTGAPTASGQPTGVLAGAGATLTYVPAGQPAFQGGFKPELYRAFWFGLGVAFTLLMTHWVR
jgi:carbon monoxide dehydrogenase subunit G